MSPSRLSRLTHPGTRRVTAVVLAAGSLAAALAIQESAHAVSAPSHNSTRERPSSPHSSPGTTRGGSPHADNGIDGSDEELAGLERRLDRAESAARTLVQTTRRVREETQRRPRRGPLERLNLDLSSLSTQDLMNLTPDLLAGIDSIQRGRVQLNSSDATQNRKTIATELTKQHANTEAEVTFGPRQVGARIRWTGTQIEVRSTPDGPLLGTMDRTSGAFEGGAEHFNADQITYAKILNPSQPVGGPPPAAGGYR